MGKQNEADIGKNAEALIELEGQEGKNEKDII